MKKSELYVSHARELEVMRSRMLEMKMKADYPLAESLDRSIKALTDSLVRTNGLAIEALQHETKQLSLEVW